MKKNLVLTFLFLITLQASVYSQCHGQFVDNGGPTGDYTNDSNNTTIICPDNAGDVVTVTFVSFNLEENYDALYVYDGASPFGPYLISSSNAAGAVPGGLPGGYWGTELPGPFTSASADGCLSFVFRSDDTQTRPGWVANVTCGPPPGCRLPVTETITELTSNSAVLHWAQAENPNGSIATTWHIIAVPCGGQPPTADATGYVTTTSNPYTLTGLSPNTCYQIYIRAVCDTPTIWREFAPITTYPSPPACGQQFVDIGGPTANYPQNADNTYIICPTNPGDIVTVVFDSFVTEEEWDALYVFDGNTLTSPQIASENAAEHVPGGLGGGFWGDTLPGPFTSTSPSGCLTFRFRSDTSGEYAGWTAHVTCTPDADKVVLISFVDTNNNGIKDANEVYFHNGSFVYQQNNNGTNINGYSPTGQFAVYDSNPANSYSFSYQIQSDYASYYNTSNTTYSNITIPAGSGAQFLYFPLTLVQAYNDLAISIAPLDAPRPGYPYTNRITYQNLGVAATDGSLTFTKPQQVPSFQTSQTPATTGDTFTYAFTNLMPNEMRSFLVTMNVPVVPLVNINDLLTDSVFITATGTDINPANNSNTNSQIVVNSFDPNDKMESRGKTIPFNQFAPDDYFFYTIRFQNNGTADAINVRIQDVLNAKIDETSIIMLSASDTYTMKRIGNQLVWDFKNIYLLPSSVNESGSKGYVQFKVKLKPGFQAGDIIPNNASIYFDSNPAIVTATFNSKFTLPLDVTNFDANNLVLYPNPATNKIRIDLVDTNQQLETVVFHDLLGKTVKKVAAVSTGSLMVDVSDLSKGVYLVEITSESHLKLTKKLIIQ